MRPLVIAFVLGAAAVAVALLAGGLALAVAAQSSGWGSFRIGVGPVTVVEFVRNDGSTSTSFGSGIALTAVAGGALNAIGAAMLRKRR